MIKVAMVDADLLDNGTRHPNLAQMKMASFYKSKGCFVRLIFDDEIDNLSSYDLIVVSKVFTYSKIPEKNPRTIV